MAINSQASLGFISVESSNGSASKSEIEIATRYSKNGTKTHKAKTENINMLQNADKDNHVPSTFESGDNVDKVLSGESLYKTFTFEQGSEEEVEKCIAFWKSVMKKKLEPIKCSIIESSNNKVSGESEKQESVDMLEKTHETIKKAEEKIHDYYKNTWTSIVDDLKKRRLEEIKLIGKSRCKMCQSQISPSDQTDASVKKDEIIELNKWKSKSKGTKKQETKDQYITLSSKASSHKSVGGQSSKFEKSVKTATCICEPTDDVVSVETVISDHRHIPRDSTRYKLIDLINEKKRTGAYSRWRKNITQPCTCGVDTCDCNLNPAILSTKPLDTCRCGHLQCQCNVISKKLSESDVDSTKGPEIEEITTKSDSEGKSSESCQCKKENCTCKKSKPTESPVTLSLKSSSSTTTKDTSVKSKDTVIVALGEVEPLHEDAMYTHGPIRKDKKADITKSVQDEASRSTLENLKSAPDTCFCKHECDCTKPKIDSTKQNDEK